MAARADEKAKAYDVAVIRERHSHAYAPWTAVEDERLRKAYEAFHFRRDNTGETRGRFLARTAAAFGRQVGAIESRLAQIFPDYAVSPSLPVPARARNSSTLRRSARPVASTAVTLPIKLEWSPEAQEALRLMEETTQSLFLTGRAGTGKSTLLTYFRNRTQKKVAVLAPTGVAAVNVHGQTIHSFCGFTPGITPSKVRPPRQQERQDLVRSLDTIVIDEVSMARADLMDCLDKFLRVTTGKTEPFGGKQMLFIGDLYQLPPVVTSRERDAFALQYPSPYFFDAAVFRAFPFAFIELETVYRQREDAAFLGLLNAIRNRSATADHLAALNVRVDTAFTPKTDDLIITLTSTNDLAAAMNAHRLRSLSGTERVFTGSVSGSFEEKEYPTDVELALKVGSQIMLLSNDPRGRWVNGTMGRILAFPKPRQENQAIKVALESGKAVWVEPYTWESFRYALDRATGHLETESIGSFTQYPMKLAWAVTIHKSQGKTFDRAIIDLGRGTFAHGQLYVALSRCRTLAGLVLRQPLAAQHIRLDWRVIRFVTSYQYRLAHERRSPAAVRKMLEEAIRDQSALAITYLKSNDEKSRRVIEPSRVGEMTYQGKTFLGVEAFCRSRKDVRVFRVDRILDIRKADGESGEP